MKGIRKGNLIGVVIFAIAGVLLSFQLAWAWFPEPTRGGLPDQPEGSLGELPRFGPVKIITEPQNQEGKIGEPAVDPVIDAINALNDDDWFVRESAAKTLGEIGDSRAVEPLIDALNDDNVLVRASAAKALGKIGDSRAVEPLIDALNDNDELVRAFAAEALANIARQNKEVKESIATELELSGKQLDIWNDFEILVLNSDGRSFSEAELSIIHNVLSTLPPNLRAGTKSILAYPPDSDVGASAFSGIILIYVGYNDDWYVGAVFHEVAHNIWDIVLTPEEKKKFEELNAASGNNPQNYASSYGMTNIYEDFAEMFRAYTRDTLSLLTQARVQAEDDDPTNDILLKKVEFIENIFAHQGKDGKMYTYIFDLTDDGIRRGQRELNKPEATVKEWEFFEFEL